MGLPRNRNHGGRSAISRTLRADAPALIFEGRSTTWREFDSRTSRIANALIPRRVSTANAVAFFGKNSDRYLELMFGAFKADMPFLPLNWRRSPDELAALLKESSPAIIFVELDLAEKLKQACAVANLSPEIIVFNPKDEQSALDVFLYGATAKDPLLPIALNSTALRLFTSGTTGPPKAVELSHASFMHMRLCEHLEPALRWSAEDIYLFALPNYHLAGVGIALQSLYNGGAVSILSEFEPAAALKVIRDTRPSITMLLPTELQMLVDHQGTAAADYRCFRLVMYAGSSISLELIRRAIDEMNCNFMQFYGATEIAGAVTLLRPSEHDLNIEDNLQSCGRPLPFVEIRIVNQEGKDVRDGETGEFLIRSPGIFKEYLNKPEATKSAKLNGWFRSGDAGYKAANGRYFIAGRVT